MSRTPSGGNTITPPAPIVRQTSIDIVDEKRGGEPAEKKQRLFATEVESAIIGTQKLKIHDASVKKYMMRLFDESLIGSKRIKEMIAMLISEIETKKVRDEKKSAEEKAEITLESLYHCAFMGPLDTGKHLTATLIARILQKLGLVKKKVFVRCRNTSAKKFHEMAPAAEGGIIFVEDAQELVSDKASLDALELVLKENKTMVFFSGSTDNLKGFFDTYPSIDTLVGRKYKFESLKVEELTEIFGLMCRQDCQVLEENALAIVNACFQKIPPAKRAHDNARLCSELLNHAKDKRNARVDPLLGRSEPELFNILLIEDLKRAMYDLEYKYEAGDERPIEQIVDEELNKIVGLTQIKDEIRSLVKTARMAKLRESNGGVIDTSKVKRHMVFSGAPGTGKTTIARLIAKIYAKLDLIPSNKVVECAKASDLKGAALGQAAKKVDELVASAGGGFIFIDEAYTLTAAGDEYGTAAVDSIMKHLDPPQGVFIFAGYTNPMEEFLRANEGLARRVPLNFVFPSYTKEQLFEILLLYAKNAKKCTIKEAEHVQIKGLLASIPKRLLESQNAGLVTNWVDRAVQEREGEADIEEMKHDASLINQLSASNFKTAMYTLKYKVDPSKQLGGGSLDEYMKKEFAKIIGQSKIKKMLEDLAKNAEMNRLIEEKTGEKGANDNTLYHMIFSGNPGTGKTMIAKIVAHMLQMVGVTSSEKVVEVKNGKDLLAQYAGQTPEKVQSKVKEAEGGVLMIDEAYALNDAANGGSVSASLGNYSQEAIDTIMKNMEPPQCVFIFCGYEDKMQEFVRLNQGLSRRVPYHFHFDNYSVEELVQIFEVVCKFNKPMPLTYDADVIKQLRILLGAVRKQTLNMSNGGIITQKIVPLATQIVKARVTREEVMKGLECLYHLTVKDVHTAMFQAELVFTPPSGVVGADGKPVVQQTAEQYMEEKFAKLIGGQKIKDLMRQIVRSVQLEKIREQKSGKAAQNEAKKFHMIFKGPPGTGKTTWAKLVSAIFLKIGVISSDTIVNVKNPLDLLAGYVGQTAGKVDKVVESAQGGVVFIDEAYSLVNSTPTGVEMSSFAKEAIDTIMKNMDPPQALFIFAGYTQPMDDFMKGNEGLKRRTPYQFEFESYTLTELLDIFKIMIKIQEQVLDNAPEIMKQIELEMRAIGNKVLSEQNGGFIESLISQAKQVRDSSLEPAEVDANPELMNILTLKHFRRALVNMNYRKEQTEEDDEMIGKWLEAEFAKIVGMKSVKDQIMGFKRKVFLNRTRAQMGLKVSSGEAYHMIFSGPPGTGKTTIAKLIARCMAKLRLTPSDQVTFVKNALDFKGQYVGHTGPKVDRIVEQAKGGVLFIDEAYSLTGRAGSGGASFDQFGQEAVDKIMAHLDPPSCTFIFAGYEREMDEFIRSNPGFQRRVPFRYRFVNYNTEELMQILLIIAKNEGQLIEEKEQPAIRALLESIPKKVREDANGGLVQNWLNQAKDCRDASMEDDDSYLRDRSLLFRLTAVHFAKTVKNLSVQQEQWNIGKGANQVEEEPLRLGAPTKPMRTRSSQEREAKVPSGYSDEEVRKAVRSTLHEVFDMMDLNKNGLIDENEMKEHVNLVNSQGVTFDSVAHNKLASLCRYDSNKVRGITRDQFEDFYINESSPVANNMEEWNRVKSRFRQGLGLDNPRTLDL